MRFAHLENRMARNYRIDDSDALAIFNLEGQSDLSRGSLAIEMGVALPDPSPLTLTPIGVAHTPFSEKVDAPRQAYVAEGVAGTIELFPGRDFEHALLDLEGWDRIWIIFWFHRNESWKPKVLPPRSQKRRGVFSTRSPHRPNPIGLSSVRLESVEGLLLHVRDIDLLDGTPILDIKPYLPIADAHPHSRTGWLDALPIEGAAVPIDPEPGFAVVWSDRAQEEAAFLIAEGGPDLVAIATRILADGPQPHPYRRIKRVAEGLVLAVKDWRIAFRVRDRLVTVDAVRTGYRDKQLESEAASPLVLHRRFVDRFGARG
jgi:tRNA-Thr(GGU) m(6)t(6)A37 methyltransferase TsaA